MQEITGINGLFSTLDAMGSGLHQGENGSFVDVHVDFNMHTEKNLERRINLLIPLILLHTNYVLDTLITLVRRILKGVKWNEPHREHLYQ